MNYLQNNWKKILLIYVNEKKFFYKKKIKSFI